MMERRDVLKGIAGLASTAFAHGIALAATSRVRVTLVRWPYT
jgi:hypothetical protein